jgi:hypothetical protein
MLLMKNQLFIFILFAVLLIPLSVVAEPGQESNLFLQSGTVNGQQVSSADREVVVSPGQEISGAVTLAYNSAWPTNINTPLGVTRNWGNPEDGFIGFGNAQGSSSKVATFNYQAPTEPGTYYLIFAYRAEITYANVFSMTNWAYSGGNQWRDGNDIYGWSPSRIEGANINGRASGLLRTNNGYETVFVPATAIKITVKSPADGSTSYMQVVSGNINNQQVSSSGSKITVNAGEAVTGSVTLDYFSSWNSNAVISFGGTSTWGDNAASYRDYGYLSTPGTGTRTVNVDWTAPTTPGKYYLIYSFNGQFNAGQVMSLTSWATGDGHAVWNDGNDIADFSQYQINELRSTGRTWGKILYNEGYNKWMIPGAAIEVNVEQGVEQPANDPGATSSLAVKGGSLNGQLLSSSNKKITVTPGQAISGTVQFDYASTFPSSAVMQFVSTPTWGERQSACANQGSLATPATSSLSANVNSVAPTTPGKYYIVFAYSGEFNKDQVCSMTNWARSAGIVYNDFNDLAAWNLSQVQQAQAIGRATSHRMYDEGYQYVYTPSDVIEVTVQQPIQNTTPPSSNSCYNSVNELPLTCKNGASVTLDTKSSSRTMECASSSGSQKVAAYTKTDSTGKYFEMYKQSSSGTIPDLCLGNTCMAGWGYRKGPYFPICTSNSTQQPSCTPATETCNQKDDDCDGQVDENNVCASQPPQSCYNKVISMPVTCNGGSIVSDTMSGCRVIRCNLPYDNPGRSLEVKACDKPGSYNATSFEFYTTVDQIHNDGTVLEICLAGKCINQAQSFKSYIFPVCT